MMRSLSGRRSCILLVLLSLILQLDPVSLALPVVGRLDDFQDGTTMGWAGGQPAYSSLIPVVDGGPEGQGDGYLSVSVEGFHLGTKHSGASWTGNYLDCGVTRIEMDLIRLSETPDLNIRLLLFGPGGVFATRTHALPVSPGASQWGHASFGVKPSDLIYVSMGTGVVEDTLRQVTTLLIRHDQETPTPPGAHPPHIAASIGIDNIQAVIRPYDVAWTFSAPDAQSYVLEAYDGFDREPSLIGSEDPTLKLHLWKRYQITVPQYATHPFELLAQGPDASTDAIVLSMDPNAFALFAEVDNVQWEYDGRGTASFTVTDTLLTFMSALPDQRPGYRCARHPDSMRGELIGCTRTAAADLNGDCVVSIHDIDQLLAEWLECYALPATLCP